MRQIDRQHRLVCLHDAQMPDHAGATATRNHADLVLPRIGQPLAHFVTAFGKRHTVRQQPRLTVTQPEPVWQALPQSVAQARFGLGAQQAVCRQATFGNQRACLRQARIGGLDSRPQPLAQETQCRTIERDLDRLVTPSIPTPHGLLPGGPRSDSCEFMRLNP